MSLTPLFRIGGNRGPGVALAGAVGQGRLLLFGDSSMLTDQQMALASHRQLLANVVDYLERPEGHVWALLPGGQVLGEFAKARQARWARLDRALA